MLIEEYLSFKRAALEKEFENMNDMQKEAIFYVNGPLLILAGAGSGKTTVIVNRIAYLLKHGDAYFSKEGFEEFEALCSDSGFEQNFWKNKDIFFKASPPRPDEILAITFTNKAAKELCERLEKILGDEAKRINAGTFHSQCIKILVRHIGLLGYNSSFAIYDGSDSKNLVKDIISSLNISSKIYQPKLVLYEISRAKNRFITPKLYEEKFGNDVFKKEIANIYKAYQDTLVSSNALDFDDILCLTVRLFKENEDILKKYQKKFKYIMVDEYQDTNYVQYELIKMLSGFYGNLCVVGDDDQSIYKFRGAAIENILNFENQIDNVKTIKLEQNYRSTKNILSAANSVISHNSMRKNKKIWTEGEQGEKIKEVHVSVENEEAEFICKKIIENVSNGMLYKDHVVLYRLNAQSANIEKFLIRHSIPYQIIGSTRFYDRKEIKDILAYFTILDNSYDNLRLMRIINEPKRGIGTGTVSKLQKLSQNLNMPIYEIIKNAQGFPTLNGKLLYLKNFYELIENLKKDIETKTLPEIFDLVVERTKYMEYLNESDPQDFSRIENLKELKTSLIQFEEENEKTTLSNFLFEISLYTDINEYNKASDKIFLMTFHSAKGLEFPVVFMIGMEEGIFPSVQSKDNIQDLEEERRLAYVGITRAKKMLYMTSTAQRMIFGATRYAKPSRFLNEIPIKYKEIQDNITKKVSAEIKTFQKNKISINNNKVLKNCEPLKIDFAKNETVVHSIFGKGVVMSITPVGNDHLVEIDFEKKGKKKIMANYAKLRKYE